MSKWNCNWPDLHFRKPVAMKSQTVVDTITKSQTVTDAEKKKKKKKKKKKRKKMKKKKK